MGISYEAPKRTKKHCWMGSCVNQCKQCQSEVKNRQARTQKLISELKL